MLISVYKHIAETWSETDSRTVLRNPACKLGVGRT